MNNAKMWLVVSPSVGVPVFLGAVAVGSFAVHLAVLGKTNWYEDYLLGNELGTSAGMESAAATTMPDAEAARAAYALDVDPETGEMTVIMPDGTVARAVLRDDVLASVTVPPSVAAD